MRVSRVSSPQRLISQPQVVGAASSRMQTTATDLGLGKFQSISSSQGASVSLGGLSTPATPALFACLTILTGALSALPIYCVRYTDSTRQAPVMVDHRINALMLDPSEVWNRVLFWTLLDIHAPPQRILPPQPNEPAPIPPLLPPHDVPITSHPHPIR